MPTQALLSALSFSLGKYQLACSLEEGQLRLRATTCETRSHQLALARLNYNDNALELTISCNILAGEENQHSIANSASLPIYSQNKIEEKMYERVSYLENYVNQLQKKLDSNSKSRKELRSYPNRSSRSNLKQQKQDLLPSNIIREHQQMEITGIIQKQMEQNMKLELLNDILQDKLLKRQGDLLDLQRSIIEREDLIRELAEKLIVANIEKQDIFNEYEKILQTNVFHQEQKLPITSQTQAQPQKLEQPVQVQIVEEVQIVENNEEYVQASLKVQLQENQGELLAGESEQQKLRQ